MPSSPARASPRAPWRWSMRPAPRRFTPRWARGIEASGGSAANTIAGLASLGGNGAYIGKLRDDQLGKIFAHDLASLGVAFKTPPLDKRPAHRALPDPGHARRAAHHEHLPRRLRRAGAGGRRRRSHRRGAGHVSRGLSVRSAARQGGLPQGGRARPRMPAARWRCRCPTPSASSATGAEFLDLVEKPRRHPVRQRARDLLALRNRAISSRRPSTSAAIARSRC